MTDAPRGLAARYDSNFVALSRGSKQRESKKNCKPELIAKYIKIPQSEQFSRQKMESHCITLHHQLHRSRGGLHMAIHVQAWGVFASMCIR